MSVTFRLNPLTPLNPYDWAGNLTQSSDGSTGTINYGRSIAGEVTSITNATYQNLPYNPPNLVSNVVAAPMVR